MYISRFGSPKNYDGGASERNHKALTKHPSRKKQMRPGLLSIQTAKSLSEMRIMKNIQGPMSFQQSTGPDRSNGLFEPNNHTKPLLHSLVDR